MRDDEYAQIVRDVIRAESPRNPPVHYKRWDGAHGDVADHGDWLPLGWAPAPRTRWHCFCAAVAHGVLMRYPLPSVLAYALRAWRGRYT